jgi:hypothetical protein
MSDNECRVVRDEKELNVLGSEIWRQHQQLARNGNSGKEFWEMNITRSR